MTMAPDHVTYHATNEYSAPHALQFCKWKIVIIMGWCCTPLPPWLGAAAPMVTSHGHFWEFLSSVLYFMYKIVMLLLNWNNTFKLITKCLSRAQTSRHHLTSLLQQSLFHLRRHHQGTYECACFVLWSRTRCWSTLNWQRSNRCQRPLFGPLHHQT